MTTKDDTAVTQPFKGWDHFDVTAGLIIVALLVAIGLVVALGDQLGIAVRSFGPIDNAPSRATIQITFDEPVDRASLEREFAIQPAVSGTWLINDNQVTFRPSESLRPNQAYTVSLGAGIVGQSGRLFKRDLRWQFRVRVPRMLYLASTTDPVQNLYLVDPLSTDKPQPLTHSQMGVVDYAVSPDGSQIVYSEIEAITDPSYLTTRLVMLNVATDESGLLYDCQAQCTDLTWRPDGSMIAFERAELNAATGIGPGAPRTWLFDLGTNRAHPLFADPQKIGLYPRWVPDGSRLAVYEDSEDVILIHDFADGKETTSPLPTSVWRFGTISPNGRWLYYSTWTGVGYAPAFHLKLVDLSQQPNLVQNLEPNTEAVSDLEGVWSADSKTLIIERQPPAIESPQISNLYRVDIATDAATRLVPDQGYTQQDLTISPVGDGLLFTRSLLSDPDAAYAQIWLYNLSTGDLKMIAPNATSPGWLP